MYVYQAAKWGTSLFGETPLKDLFADDICGQADEGQLLYGWSRESFEMIDECWQAHTEEDTKANFDKPIAEQDPFFGVTGIIKRLMKRANEIR